ncbi:phage tail protein [Cumulibacter manganitolerans]|uniref:phage tail protein n=1 Tax=Cumulibacter manganitolerans TaxID=1884992 RepID=UPI001294BFA3|nr:phage tail protein [Cumulibacter manganitolerans]
MSTVPVARVTEQPTYRFFNTGDGWPGLTADGVRVDERGDLTLERVPAVIDPVALDPCATTASRTPVVGPRGRAYRLEGSELLVLEAATGQRLTTWGPLDEPRIVLADPLTVVVVESTRLARFDADGARDVAWQERVTAWSGPLDVVDATLARLPDGPRVVVLDRTGPERTRLLAVAPDGTQDAARTTAWAALRRRRRDPGTGSWQTGAVDAITSVAVDQTNERLLVVSGGELLCFTLDGGWVGRALTGSRSLTEARVTTDHCGRARYVARTVDGTDLFLDPHGGHVPVGTFVCGPISCATAPATWRELRTRVTGSDAVRLWTLGSDTPDAPPASSVPGDVAAPVVPWRAVPGDCRGALVASAPSRYLWLGGLLTGAPGAGDPPRLEQVQVDVATASWLDRLPEIYRDPGPPADFLDAFLRGLQSVLRDDEERLAAMPARFDPLACADTRSGGAPGQLDDLAGWLGVTLDEKWDTERRRAVVAEAHRLYARRGTAAGLERLLSLCTGATVEVVDPVDAEALWVLDDAPSPAPPALGISTRLTAAVPGGAVVDSSAYLDRATLSDGTDYGAPLYEPTAHRFCVRGYAADLPDPRDRDALRVLIEAEKPAHAAYHLCLIDAHARVGFQARVGLDAVVAGRSADLVLDAAARLGTDAALGGTPAAVHLDPARRVRTGTARLGTGLHLT